MHAAPLLLLFVSSVLLAPAAAILIPFRREHVLVRRPTPVSRTLASRSAPVDVLSGYSDINNTRYVGNVTLSGRSFGVILDTGSHDMWLKPGSTLAHYTNTSVTATIDYGGGTGTDSSIEGFILLTETQFANFTVQNQAFINVITGGAGNIAPGIEGLMGLAPPSETGYIQPALKEAKSTANGSTILENIFAQNPEVEPQFTMLMSRNDGDMVSAGGAFTIGEPISEYAAILDQPILPLANTTVGLDHWVVHMDGMLVNGKWYNTSSRGTQNLTAMLDSGTPTASIDPTLVYAIYGDDVQTASNGFTPLVPCDAQITLSFVFGGVEFPIDPLDVIQPAGKYDNGSLACTGAFSQSVPSPEFPDLLLGTSFLRNVYALYNHNTWKKAGNTTLPFVQLLSVTNATLAAEQFPSLNAARIAAFEETYSISTSSSSSNSQSTRLRDAYIGIGILGGALLLTLVALGLTCYKARAKAGPGYSPVRLPKVEETTQRQYATEYAE